MGNETILAGLRGGALAAAQSFLQTFPDAVLTSGLRMVDAQCSAMASNEQGGHLDWISRTYKDTPVEEACSTWVRQNPELASNVDSCEAGLLGVFATFPPDQLRQISWHLSGDAFDVTVPTPPEQIALLQQLVFSHVASGGRATLLTQEGGLARTHLQFA